MDNVDNAELKFPSPGKEICFIGITLCLYYLILFASQFMAPGADRFAAYLLPGLLMLAASLVWIYKFKLQKEFFTPHPSKLSSLCNMSSIVFFVLILFNIILAFVHVPPSDTWSYWQLCVIFLAPVAEETFFRGIMLRHFEQTFGRINAIIIVSISFALLHKFHAPLPSILVLSVFLTVVASLSKSVLWPIVFHMEWNAFVELSYIGDDSLRRIIGVIALIVIAVMISLAVKRDPERTGPRSFALTS